MGKKKLKIVPYIDPKGPEFVKILYTFEIESFEKVMEKLEKGELDDDPEI